MTRARRRLEVAVALAVLVLVAWAEAKGSEQTSELHFLVVRQENKKPVRNASVVLHRIDKDGGQRDTLQLKTDSEGRASIDGIPYGRLRVQVIAPRRQTFGKDYDIKQPTVDFQIELNSPQQQLSIY
jgi:hypothetical protein